MKSEMVTPTVCLLLSLAPGFQDGQLPSILKTVDGLSKRDGLVANYLDPAKGRLLIKLPPPRDPSGLVGEYLYVDSLGSGSGANQIGLDRAESGQSFIVRFKIRGEKLVVEAVNTGFRATSDNPDERLATEMSFPTSVIWAGPLTARDSDGSTVVDMTSFIVRDAHDTGRDLGDYTLDKDRSYLRPEGCFSFPDNLEWEAELTFKGNGHSPVAETSPKADVVTMIQHHSLVKLPSDGYRMRAFDPRSGFFGMDYYDFGAKLNEPLIKRVLCRHRLEKTDPNAAISQVKKPIVYYLDRGTPEPIRSALLDGARWWAQAFEAAGFKDAFRVEMLPESANPLDVRYNMIQWIHRSTRGYSFGGSIIDPRTGEIIKATVRLDSSRIRQDLKIFEGLAGAGGALTGGQNDMTIPGLARIRQLAAHEVGHTLGLRHNFAGSTFGNRASVMDYPGPKLSLKTDGSIDFSDAYGVGVGAWDKFAIWYGYSEFPTGTDETKTLQTKASEAIHAGALVYLPDEDDPAVAGADWRSSKWDNGNDPVAGLRNTMAIRRAALATFGERNLRDYTPRSELQDALGPIYFFHRYDLATACKVVGGYLYQHQVKEPTGMVPPPPNQPVAGSTQRAALGALLDCISPDELDLPDDLLNRLNPPSPGYGDSRESFRSNTTYVFDSAGAANTAADLALSELLNPVRCTRIVELSSRDSDLPNLEEVLTVVVNRIFNYTPKSERRAEMARGIQGGLLDRLLDLIDADVPRSVKARALSALQLLKTQVEARISGSSASAQHAKWMLAEIDKFMNRPLGEAKRVPHPLGPMPGSPIGCGWQ
ncbi:MAG: zinc-dependent metalloprotease [Armatimonadetes bacterium]|nr:zinc-dependent metalloprotease [Armatimonadota bacterium]